MKEQNKKTVFTVLTKTNHYLINYSAFLAKSMDLDLVFYVDNSEIYNEIWELSQKITKSLEVEIKLSRKKANIYSWFGSVCDIASKENAEIVVMTVCKEKVGFLGESLWDKTQKLNIPILLLPEQIMFNEIENIVISADSSMKIQKTGIVIKLAKIFNSKIHIFKENVETPSIQKIINIISRNISKIFKENGIVFVETKARNTKNFAKHLCKYSSKNGDLLIVEVDTGRINRDTKRQIETLLKHNKPVLLKKTNNTAILAGFNS